MNDRANLDSVPFEAHLLERRLAELDEQFLGALAHDPRIASGLPPSTPRDEESFIRLTGITRLAPPVTPSNDEPNTHTPPVPPDLSESVMAFEALIADLKRNSPDQQEPDAFDTSSVVADPLPAPDARIQLTLAEAEQLLNALDRQPRE